MGDVSTLGWAVMKAYVHQNEQDLFQYQQELETMTSSLYKANVRMTWAPIQNQSSRSMKFGELVLDDEVERYYTYYNKVMRVMKYTTELD